MDGLKSNVPRQCALKQVVSYFGKRKLNSIEDTDILLYKRDRLNATLKNGNPYAIATINKELAELRQLLKRAKKKGVLKRLPDFDGVISKKAETKRARTLKGDEEARLLAACELPDKQGRFMRLHVRPIIICALDKAMRRGEILQLQWRDVRFNENAIKLRADTTKTEEAREIPISKRLRVELETMYGDQNAKPTDKVFRRKVLGRHAGKQVSQPYFVDITDNFQSSW